MTRDKAGKAEAAGDPGDGGAKPRWDLDDVGVVAAGIVYALLAAFPWYEGRGPGGEVLGYIGWGLGWTMVGGLLALYAAGRVVFLRGAPPKPDVPVTPAAETFVVAVLALIVTLYRVVVVPSQVGPGATRTSFISAAAAAVVFQAVFAARKLGKVGLRA